jgi:hypothetical protein
MQSPFIQNGAFRPDELRLMQCVVETACSELGVFPDQRDRREAIAESVVNSWQRGRRNPLDLVHAAISAP